VGSVWRSDRGGVLIPFDPTAAIDALRAERYRGGPSGGAGRRGRAARSAYYVVRPLVPRRAQLAARRRLSRVRAHRPFPHWPWEPALHDLADRLAGEVAGALGAPLPCLAPWPAGRTWALVLTHDVETAVGRDAIERVRAVERAAGLRSSWNLVPERYRVPDELVERLRGEDCEVGVHGLRHDGRDLGSLQELERRLPEMQRWGRRWGASGFRSPATLRRWEWMPLLGFDYDSSSPDTDPFEPIPGGCCSWLPFFNRDLVELPITLPQDHALLEILRCGTAVWHEKTARLRARGGMALLITHPDYLLGDAELDAYRSFLTGHAGDPDVWHALPGEVSAWWRRRAASRLVRGDGGWRVEGPAAGEAAIAHVGPPAPTA
jgi:hypothetical protein